MDLENLMLSETSRAEKENTVRFASYEEPNEQKKLTNQVERDSVGRGGKGG